MVTAKRTIAIATLSLLTAGAIAPANAQNPPPPMVSPDPIADIPITNFDPSLLFANYSWRSFIALNWPAKTGAANRGQPDRTKAFGDISGPRVWSTWKSRYEIFQPGGVNPSPWASYDGKNPCGDGFSNEVVTLSSFTAFGDFNQATFSLANLGNPLVAQTKLYTRYEVRMNQQEFESIVGHKWFLASNLPTANAPVPFNDGSTEVKAAWRILTPADTPAIRARYYIIPNAQVFDVASAKCATQDIALVGFHISRENAEPAAVDMVVIRTRRQRAGNNHGAETASRHTAFVQRPQQATGARSVAASSPAFAGQPPTCQSDGDAGDPQAGALARKHDHEQYLLEPVANQRHRLAKLHARDDAMADPAVASGAEQRWHTVPEQRVDLEQYDNGNLFPVRRRELHGLPSAIQRRRARLRDVRHLRCVQGRGSLGFRAL